MTRGGRQVARAAFEGGEYLEGRHFSNRRLKEILCE